MIECFFSNKDICVLLIALSHYQSDLLKRDRLGLADVCHNLIKYIADCYKKYH